MSEIQRLPPVMNPNPVHPNAKTTTQITNGTTTTKTNIGLPVCRNCKTQTTPLWRRDETGQVLCNACGLFLKLHGRPRPISLKTDTIKLRNRIKQPNFSKLLGPNTPELKLKDAKTAGTLNGVPHRHRLPLLAPGKRLPQDSPLEPLRPGNYAPAPFSSAVFPSLGGHFHAAALPHQVQLLHYPSSTPTQFAPGLQRITSPLLLLTSPLVLNARSATGAASPPSSLTAMQAAGALENMSNELGPSASFKGAPGTASGSGVSLLGPSKLRPDSPQIHTPKLAPNDSPKPPLLPALGTGHDSSEKVLPSPSFGPQFALLDAQPRPKSVEHPMPSLPPIQHTLGSSMPLQLPHLPSNLGTASYSAIPTPEQRATPVPLPHQIAQQPPQASVAASGQNHLYGAEQGYSGMPSILQSHSASGSGSAASEGNSGKQDSQGKRNGRDDQDQNHNSNHGRGSGGGGSTGGSSYEVNVLRTRISELELVNDLYRTRIMELEAMEQAARLRENSMRKRLDDLLRAQGYDDSLSMLNSTMRVLKREESFADDASKRQKTG